MEDFDWEEKSKEQREKELYEKMAEKQHKNAKSVLTIVFGALGSVYLTIGLIALFAIDEPEANIVGYVFSALGILFIVASIIVMVAMPKKGNYEKYKAQINRFGYTNTFDLSARVEMLKEENRQLEMRVEELERKVRNLESR